MSTPNTLNTKSEAEQVLDFLRFIFKNWRYFAISFLFFGILGAIYYKIATPIFNVAAQVALRQDESLAGNPSMSSSQSLMSAFGFSSGSDNIEDEVLKISSQGYIRNVVKNLELNKEYMLSEYGGLSKTSLFDESPIHISADPEIADTLTKIVSFKVKVQPNKTKVTVKAGKHKLGKFEINEFPATLHTSWGNFTLDRSPYWGLYDNTFTLRINYSGYDYMAQNYRKDILVDFEKKTSKLMQLNLYGENIPFTKNILTEVIDIYNKEWNDDKKLVAEQTVEFINQRLALTYGLLSDIDLQIREFKDKYNLTAIEADVTYYLESNGLLQVQLLEAETQLNIVDIISDFVKDEKNKYLLIPFSLSTSKDASMGTVISKYNEQLILRNDLYKANPNAPSVMAKSLDEQIETQRKNVLTSLANMKKELQVSLATAKRKEQDTNNKISKIPAIEQDFVSMKRNQELQQAVYLYLLQMREETAVKGINILPKLKVIDAPYAINKPISPSLFKTAILILFLGFVSPLCYIYAKPYIRRLIVKLKNK
ncbi:MAG: hypothetical protein LBN18_05690 [Dysgonamonadaceae bacterium]|jgi:uncharacterized protein involved in exopolysaccharide biosynthesis|nr:hypothetical protein [Dysgonamonadaceae bacterium]